MTSGADRIEALIKKRIDQRLFEHSRHAGDPGSARFAPFILPGKSSAHVQDYLRQRWSLEELLRFHDRQFVQNAYLVLLKRDADIEGLNNRLRKLQSAELSRVEVLFRLRFGPEGKARATRVSGLMRAFLLERLCRIPLLGLVPACALALLRLPRMQREIEEIRGLIAMQKNDSDDKLQALVDFQNDELGRIAKRLKK